MPTGGDYTITASTTQESVKIERVTFGDVYFCSGQSNMQLPLHFTYEGNYSSDNVVKRGMYHNIRHYLHAPVTVATNDTMYVSTKDNQDTWYNVSYSAAQPDIDKHHLSPFHSFSATCMHFGMALIDKTGDTTTPIGLIESAVGGTRIESWMSNVARAKCTRLADTGGWEGNLYRTMVAPFVNMSLTGFLWYQGENSCGGWMGNSMDGTGYGCAQVELVRSWREIWSAEEGTTNAMAPFGVVSLASRGYEGHGANMSHMRWSQTGNYGVLPNPAMPNTFMGHAYDLGDPWAFGSKCAHPNSTTGKYAPGCLEWSADNFNKFDQVMYQFVHLPHTPVYMGPIHPRPKYPVGRRLAEAYYNLVMGGKAAYTGPTLSGCEVDADSVLVKFNKTLLRGDQLTVAANYNYSGFTDSNVMMLCTGADPVANVSTCACLVWAATANQEWFCLDGPGWKPEEGVKYFVEEEAVKKFGRGSPYQPVWQPAPVVADTASTVKIDLSRVNTTGGIFAVKYAWSRGADTCCSSQDFAQGHLPCFLAMCPIMDMTNGFPVNPFFATIENKKCKCMPPQTCDE